jgi:hypothetical protein
VCFGQGARDRLNAGEARESRADGVSPSRTR